MDLSCDLLRQIRKYVRETEHDWNYITPLEFYTKYFSKKGREKDYVVIDLRKKADYDRFHLPHAVNLFWLDLFSSKHLQRLRTYHEEGKQIFFICYVGHTSSQAMTLVKLLGIPVVSIKFGYGISPDPHVPIAGWVQYGFPLEIRDKKE